MKPLEEKEFKFALVRLRESLRSRAKRLDVAPEFRPILWGEASQANDDLEEALGLIERLRADSVEEANG